LDRIINNSIQSETSYPICNFHEQKEEATDSLQSNVRAFLPLPVNHL